MNIRTTRPIHADFLDLLRFKEKSLIDLFMGLREFVIEIYPRSNELLYHTHALTAVFSISDKLSDSFCTIPIYTSHLNLGFNKGTLLDDPMNLLTGTGNLIRHIRVRTVADYENKEVKDLIHSAAAFAISDMDKPTPVIGQTISKIRTGGDLPYSEF